MLTIIFDESSQTKDCPINREVIVKMHECVRCRHYHSIKENKVICMARDNFESYYNSVIKNG